MNDNKEKYIDNRKKLWLVIAIAAAAAAVLIVVFVLMPMLAPREEVTPANPEHANAVAEIEVRSEAQQAAAEGVSPEKNILPEYAELYERNSDFAGWIRIEDTAIDYPVMYAPDDYGFYLYRTFDGEDDPTKQGCIFIDENCTLEPRSANLLMHGHNMKNGTMFHDLLEYKSEEFYQQHKTIDFHTLYSKDEYEIISVFLSRVYNKTDEVFKFYKFFDAASEEEFDYYIENIKELALYETGVTAEFGDELISLATCEYTQEDGRLVVVAKKIV